MLRIRPEYLEPDASNRSAQTDVLLREEPDEEEEEHRKQDDEDEDTDDGYSE